MPEKWQVWIGMPGSFPSEWVAGLNRNRWQDWLGIPNQKVYLSPIKEDDIGIIIELMNRRFKSEVRINC